MDTHKDSSRSQLWKPRASGALLAISFLAVCGIVLAVSTVRSQIEERELKNTVPAHVPIKVKVKNEKSFKDMKNKEWARELEIEVKNTGSKPIYYLYVVIVLPETISQGHSLAFQVVYGRKELLFWETAVGPDDVPIRPGESITLKVPEKQAKGYEKWRDEEKRADPKKVEFHMQLINFGDGTGIRGADGRV